VCLYYITRRDEDLVLDLWLENRRNSFYIKTSFSYFASLKLLMMHMYLLDELVQNPSSFIQAFSSFSEILVKDKTNIFSKRKKL
jgi:hypothetical protein